MALGGMTAVMDQLVAGARSLRDTTFNSLDAVQRQTKAACDEIAARVAEHNREQAESLLARAGSDVRDDRFDPEDEWEVDGPGLAAGGPPADTSSTTASSRSARDEEDDYPDTWLR